MHASSSTARGGPAAATPKTPTPKAHPPRTYRLLAPIRSLPPSCVITSLVSLAPIRSLAPSCLESMGVLLLLRQFAAARLQRDCSATAAPSQDYIK